MRLFITLLAAMSLAGTLPFLLCEFIFHTMKKGAFPRLFNMRGKRAASPFIFFRS